MRTAFAAALILSAAFTATADEPRNVTRAKEQYLKTVNRAEDQLIEQLEEAAASVAKDGEIERAIEIRNETYRLRFGEWVTSIEGPGPKTLESARQEFIGIVDKARGELATATEAGVKELGADGKLTEARQMADRIEELKSGRWEPAGDNGSVALAHYVEENGGRLWPLDDSEAPNELAITPYRRGVLLAGEGKLNTARVNGQTCGWFGKAVIFRNRRVSGLLKAGTGYSAAATHYFAGILEGGVFTHRVAMEIPSGTIHQWSFRTSRGMIHFELRHGDKVLVTVSAPATRNTMPVIMATVRRPGDKADIRIAVD